MRSADQAMRQAARGGDQAAVLRHRLHSGLLPERWSVCTVCEGTGDHGHKLRDTRTFPAGYVYTGPEECVCTDGLVPMAPMEQVRMAALLGHEGGRGLLGNGPHEWLRGLSGGGLGLLTPDLADGEATVKGVMHRWGPVAATACVLGAAWECLRITTLVKWSPTSKDREKRANRARDRGALGAVERWTIHPTQENADAAHNLIGGMETPKWTDALCPVCKLSGDPARAYQSAVDVIGPEPAREAARKAGQLWAIGGEA